MQRRVTRVTFLPYLFGYFPRMNDLKEIAVAWGLALVLLAVGIFIAEFETRQIHPVSQQTVVRFTEPLPSAEAPASFYDPLEEEFR